MAHDFIPQFVVAFFFVAANAFRRYNTPETNRSTTTFENFSIFCGLYLLATFVLFTLITAGFLVSPEVVEYFMSVPDYAESMSAPMISALFLTSMLPNLPFLARLDKALLNWFWDRGNIPTHIANLAATMRRSPFGFAPDRKVFIKQYCEDHAIDCGSINIEDSHSLDFRWARAYVLFKQLDEWKDDSGANTSGRLRRFLKKESDELKAIHNSVEEVSREFFELKRDHLDSRAEKRVERVLDSALRDTYRKLTLFIAKTVCMVELSENGRNRRIREFGFDLAEAHAVNLTGEQILKALLSIVTVFLLISLVETVFSDGQGIRRVPFLTVLMSGTYGAALLIALHLNNSRAFGFNELTRRRSFIGYLMIIVSTLGSWFVLAAIVRFVANMFRMPTEENMLEVAEHISWSYPYALQSVALALSVSWALNQHQSTEVRLNLTHVNKWRDVGKTVPLMACFSIAAYCWMNGVFIPDDWATRDLQRIQGLTARDHLVDGAWFLTKGVAVVAVLIWLVPTWFFVNRSSRPTQAANRLIEMNDDEIAREIKKLGAGDLLSVVSAIAAKVASVDDDISHVEIEVYKQICCQLSAVPNSDVDPHESGPAFDACLRSIRQNELNLKERLACLSRKPLLLSLMPYIASTIAHADGVYLKEEGEVVAEVQRLTAEA